MLAAGAFRCEKEEAALAVANRTPFGLAAYVFTQDIRRSWRVGEALEFGMVDLNTGAIAMEVAPLRRRQAVRPRPRRLAARHRGIPRDQALPYRRAVRGRRRREGIPAVGRTARRAAITMKGD